MTYRGPSTPYPMTEDEVREACAAWFSQRFGGATDPGMVVIGIETKRVPEGMGFYSERAGRLGRGRAQEGRVLTHNLSFCHEGGQRANPSMSGLSVPPRPPTVIGLRG